MFPHLREKRLPDVPPPLRQHGEEQALAEKLERLLATLDRALNEIPVEVEQRPNGHAVWGFGAIGYRTDPRARVVRPLVRHEGVSIPQRIQAELFRPLCTRVWLFPLLRHLGLSDPWQQRHLFVDDDMRSYQQRWLPRVAWERMPNAPRFTRLRRQLVPSALALDRELLSIALASRTYPRGCGFVSSRLYNRVWGNEAAFRQVAREN